MRNWRLNLITIIALVFIVFSSISNLPVFKSYATSCGTPSVIVQCTAANTNGTIANSGTTSTITVHAGNSLIIVAGFSSGNAQNTGLTCSDNLAQSWTIAVQQNQFPNSGEAQDSIICYLTNTVGGSDAFTVTATSAAQGTISIAGYEVNPTVQFTGIEISNVCNKGQAVNCVATGVSGISASAWTMNNSNATLVLSVLGGSPTGTNDEILQSGFDAVVTQNNNGNANITQQISEGGGGSYRIATATGHWNSGVFAAFGPFLVTHTSTITGWVFPNFANGVNSFSWFIGFLILLIPLSMVDTVFLSGSLNIDRNVVIFINLAMLFLGALLATMVNQLPFAIPFVFGMFLVVFLWRGRG